MLATKTDACREYACNFGIDHPEQAWILTDYDTWEHNPHYQGPAVPHPEDYHGEEDDRDELERERDYEAGRKGRHVVLPMVPTNPDEIPF